MRLLHKVLLLSVACAVIGVVPDRAYADPTTFHLIQVSEVFTNADGTVQFIELKAVAPFQTQIQNARVNARSADGATLSLIIDFTAPFPALDNNETLLLATSGAATSLGFSPDFIIPDGSVPLHDGRIEFSDDLGSILDAVAYGNYTGDMTGYGSPAPPLPCDGFTSITRVTFSTLTKDNSTDFILAGNSPTRNDGTSGVLGTPNPTPPVLSTLADQNINQGSVLNLTSVATDCNGTFPAMSAFNVPANATFTPHANGTGSFTFAPTTGQFGNFNVGFVASDGVSADTQTVNIAVNAVPQARDTAVVTSTNTLVAAQLQAFDPDGGPLTFTVVSGPFNGSISGFVASSGSFVYTPTLNYSGSDSITFQADDGLATSNNAVVRISVTGTCACPDQGDVDVASSPGVVDVFDVIKEIDIAFSGAADMTDPLCTTSRGDVDRTNSSGVVDVFDVIRIIDIAFSGGSADDPCAP